MTINPLESNTYSRHRFSVAPMIDINS